MKTLATTLTFIVLSLCAAKSQHAKAPEKAEINVNAAMPGAELDYSWAFFGNDEANWSYTPYGKKLLQDLNALSPVPVNMRAHHLFTSGDPATTRLKWSPTDIYSEDKQGNPVYNWENIDKLFDTYLESGIKPFVELGFMPKALSVKKEPYDFVFLEKHMKHHGFVYPPENYDKWASLVRTFIRHLRDRYGQNELESWLWEVWNEPDIFFWQGTTEEYLKLYDYAAYIVKDELPNARLGGPTSTAPTNESSAQFLRDFLNHIKNGENYYTGKKGSPLDFISIHSKGRVKLEAGKVQMGSRRHLARLDWAFQVISEFPELKKLPIILGESDPEGTAAFNIKDRPENIFRQGPIYPAYNIAVLNKIHELAKHYGLDVQGNLTWAFHFEGSSYFEGYRELATNGINKAVLNGFRMLGLMTGDQLPVTTSQGVEVTSVVEQGMTGDVEISALAARNDEEVTVLVWNYHDQEADVPPTDVSVNINGLPNERVLIEHFRVDEHHGNPYRLWLEMGAPEYMTDEQIARLHEASELPLYESPSYTKVDEGKLKLSTSMPRFSLSLYRVTW